MITFCIKLQKIMLFHLLHFMGGCETGVVKNCEK